MKILLSLLIALNLYSSDVFDPSEYDKQLHMGVSFAIANVANAACHKQGYLWNETWIEDDSNCKWLAIGTSMLFGLTKELYDELSYGGFSHEDLQADLVGSVLGSFTYQFVILEW